jgi:hypothetical protein
VIFHRALLQKVSAGVSGVTASSFSHPALSGIRDPAFDAQSRIKQAGVRKSRLAQHRDRLLRGQAWSYHGFGDLLLDSWLTKVRDQLSTGTAALLEASIVEFCDTGAEKDRLNDTR